MSYKQLKEFSDAEISQRVKEVRELLSIPDEHLCFVLDLTEREIRDRDEGRKPWTATELWMFAAATATSIEIFHDEEVWSTMSVFLTLLGRQERPERNVTYLQLALEGNPQFARLRKKEAGHVSNYWVPPGEFARRGSRTVTKLQSAQNETANSPAESDSVIHLVRDDDDSNQ